MCMRSKLEEYLYKIRILILNLLYIKDIIFLKLLYIKEEHSKNYTKYLTNIIYVYLQSACLKLKIKLF